LLICAADLFLLSSNYEGLPTVVIESLAVGTPVVSTACPHGPQEILDNGRYGILVPVNDREAFIHGIRLCLVRSWDSHSLKKRAMEFSVASRALEYLQYFELSNSGHPVKHLRS
jgi:glycosyltransferase involved in cell wall biosynthesis